MMQYKRHYVENNYTVQQKVAHRFLMHKIFIVLFVIALILILN
jgi:hypothetical protein